VLKKVSKFTNTVSNFCNIFGFEICEGFFSILKDDFSIIDAGIDIIETFGLDGTLKDTSDDSFDLLDIIGRSKSWLDSKLDLDIIEHVFSRVVELIKSFLSIFETVIDSVLDVMDRFAEISLDGLNNSVLHSLEVFG
jgi:hypothetical protein